MKKNPEKLLDMQCPRCGRVTHHYLSVNGEIGSYKCVRCQNINKTIKVKPSHKVTFEMDPEFEAELNPSTDPVEEIIEESKAQTEEEINKNPV